MYTFFKFKVLDGWKDDPKVKLVMEDGEDHISAVKMREILKTALDRALTRLQNTITLKGGEEVSVSRTEGMAVTVCLNPVNGGNYSIDIDLVAVLRFPITKLPSTLKQHLSRIQGLLNTSVDECLGVALPLVQEERLEVDFPQVTRDMMSNKPALKMAIRLLKAERNDIGGPFKKVKSFMIKMVALHCVMDKPDPEFWEEKYLVDRYQELRNRLQQSLETDMLTDIFFPNLNIMNRIKVPQVKSDVARYLDKSQGPPTAKQQDPIIHFFSCSPEQVTRCHNIVFRLLHSCTPPRRTMKAGMYLVLFLNKDMDVEDILNMWTDVLLNNTGIKNSEIEKSPNSLHFTLDGVPIGLIPIVFFCLVFRKHSVLVSAPCENKDLSSNLEVRKIVTKAQRSMLEATLKLYTGALEGIEAENPGITGTDLRDKFEKVVDEVIEYTGSWVSSTEKHEDKDVTFNISLKGNNSMQVSFDFDIVKYM